MFAVHQVPQHQVHIGRTGGGIQAALHGQAVQGTLGRGVQKEFRSFADLRKVQFRLGRPFADKSRQSVRRETEVLHVEVHPGGLDLGKAGHGSVRPAGNAAAKLLEGKTPDLEMVHRAFHPARNIGFEGKVVQLRGEMADRLHGEDRRSAELTLHPDLFEEAAVVVDGGQEPEILQVQVRIVVLDVEVVQKDLFMTHFHLSGDIPDVPSRLVGYPDVVRDAGDFPVLDEQVGGGHIGQDLQVVPVDDAGIRLPAFLRPPAGCRVVYQAEPESFDFHPGCFQEVSELFVGTVGSLQGKDAVEVAGTRSLGSARLDDEIEASSFEPEPAHGDPFLAEESLEGEPGRKGSDAQERVPGREETVAVRVPVLDDDILEDDGVEGFHGHGSDLDVPVEVAGQSLHGLPGKPGLDDGRLGGNQDGQHCQQQQCQDPERYAKTLLHQSTNIMILREDLVIFAPRNENYGRYHPRHRIFL